MPAAVVPAAIGAVGNIVGGIAGQAAGAGDRGEARNAAILAQQAITALREAPDESKPIIWNQLKQQGILTPELEQTILAQQPEIAEFKQRADVMEAQTEALKALGERAKTGLTAVERQALSESREAAATEAEAKRQQILQNLQARGLAGSGSELAAQLSASQAAAQEESKERARIMAQAQQQALQAASQAGTLGTQIGSQEFQQALGRSQAMSEMDRFNIANQTAQQQRNVASRNAAQAANLAEQQRIYEYNTELQNRELLRQSQERTNKWLNDLKLAGAKSGAYSGSSKALGEMGQQAATGAQSFFSGLGKAGSGIAEAFNKKDEDEE